MRSRPRPRRIRSQDPDRSRRTAVVSRLRGAAAVRRPTLRQRASDSLRALRGVYIRSIIAWPKPEQDTCVAPSIRRAKS